MTQLKAIIIDDEPLACMLLQEMLHAIPKIDIISVCHDGFEGLKAIQDHQPDLIFLDIQMPKITGVEMLELIPNPPKVIFTTAYDNFAIKAFELNAIDYLLKPYAQDRLQQAVEKALVHNHSDAMAQEAFTQLATPETASRIVVKDGNAIKVIPVEEVMYIEAASDYVKVHTLHKYYLKHGTMQHFESVLPSSQFIRVHRSYIVNTGHIHKVELYEKGNYCIVLRSNAIVPVSKSGYPKLKEFLR